MDDFNQNTEVRKDTEMLVSAESVNHLVKAAKWGKFLAIFGFVVTGLLVVAGVIMSFVLDTLSEDMMPQGLPFSPKVLSVLYILIAAVYLIPVIFLNSFSNKIIKAADTNNSTTLTQAFKSLKNLFLFIGIATIVVLAFYVIVLLVAGTAAVFTF